MAELAAFFDSVGGDREYNSQTFADVFEGGVATEGVVRQGAAPLRVDARVPVQMGVRVNPGGAWVRGRYYENSANLDVVVPAANGALPRIDRVVVRQDLLNRTMALVYVQGVAAVAPAAPALTQTAQVWEVSLATISVPAADVDIAAGQITDTRTFSSVLGAVPLVKTDATALADKLLDFGSGGSAFSVEASGKMSWGPAGLAKDTTLDRLAAGALRLGGRLETTGDVYAQYGTVNQVRSGVVGGGVGAGIEFGSAANFMANLSANDLGIYTNSLPRVRVNSSGITLNSPAGGVVTTIDASGLRLNAGSLTIDSGQAQIKGPGGTVRLYIKSTDQPADGKVWDIVPSGTNLEFRAINDIESAAHVFMRGVRSAASYILDRVEFMQRMTIAGSLAVNAVQPQIIVGGSSIASVQINNSGGQSWQWSAGWNSASEVSLVNVASGNIQALRIDTSSRLFVGGDVIAQQGTGNQARIGVAGGVSSGIEFGSSSDFLGRIAANILSFYVAGVRRFDVRNVGAYAFDNFNVDKSSPVITWHPTADTGQDAVASFVNSSWGNRSEIRENSVYFRMWNWDNRPLVFGVNNTEYLRSQSTSGGLSTALWMRWWDGAGSDRGVAQVLNVSVNTLRTTAIYDTWRALVIAA